MMSRDELSDRARFYQRPVDELRRSGVEVTYFEYLTALAMSHFAAKKVDVVVLETGLGGRLDATNAVETMVCGITPIGLEHTTILGDTLSKIASEKAGIIKSPDQRVVIAPQAPEAMAVFEARCREFGITPTMVGKDLAMSVRSQTLDGVVFDVEGRRAYRGLTTKLVGEHQAMNAATAVGMTEDLEMFGFLLTEEAVARGVREAVWPARFEIVRRDPVVILDCAHTKESAEALASTFASVFPGRKAVVVFGVSSDKDSGAVARALELIAEQVILTKANHPRAFDFTRNKTPGIFKTVPSSVTSSVGEAITDALAKAGRNSIIVVTGSLFVAAEARRFMDVPV
jgi:dihydrofolate synthase/folylpolyglutamate synthase